MTSDASQHDGPPLFDRVSRFKVAPAVATVATTAVRRMLDTPSDCTHVPAPLVCATHTSAHCGECWAAHWATDHDLVATCDQCGDVPAEFCHVGVAVGSHEGYEVTLNLCEPCRTA